MYAIVPAAGSGARMGSLGVQCPKVLLPIGEFGSVLRLSLQALHSSGVLSGVVIAAKEEYREEISHLAKEIFGEGRVWLVAGGASRQESVYNALKELEGRAHYVLVHDAARPFVLPSLISETAKCVRRTDACLLAVPAKATLKQSKNAVVERTVPREGIWEAQTPQAFRYDLLVDAHTQAIADGYQGTDDCELVERLGHKVHIVEGSDANIKITTPEDLKYAEALLEIRRRGEK